MSKEIKVFTAIVTVCFISMSCAEEQTGQDIMTAVEKMLRSSNNASFARIKLSSCRFGVTSDRITCAERPRIKIVETVTINLGADKKDTKSISITREPASERGVGMLNFTYHKTDRENQTWLYLSALGRAKRIATGASHEYGEPASIFGSEFTTEDVNYGNIEDYNISILSQATLDGRSIWKLEAIPVTVKAKRSRYARTVYFIDKERYVSLRSEMYDKYDKQIKRSISSRVEMMNGYWVARSVTMFNLVSNRLSNMAMVSLHMGLTVSEDFLTQRSLTDNAYRESVLNQLRSQTK